MASEEDHTVYGEEDLDEDDDDDVSEEEEDLTLPNDDDEVDDEDDSLSSPAATAGEVTIAVAGVQPLTSTPASLFPVPLSDPKRQRIDDVTIAAVSAAAVEEKKQQPLPSDESRRLFQRLWTDEDEIELLNGFLDYTNQRGPHHNSSHHHHDTTAFYDQIKSKLQLDFNKNQLVEKLRRLKKKYRNVLSKIGSGKDYAFKSPHDQATFEISCKIWGSGAAPGLDEDDPNPNPNAYSTPTANFNLNDHSSNGFVDPEKKTPRARKRSRGGVKIEEKSPLPQPVLPDQSSVVASIPSLVEDTVKSCLSPLFKELLNNAVNGPVSSRGFGGGVSLNPMPLGFGGSFNYSSGDVADEKWRKQHILELEVYSKRLELVQDEVKSQLEELKSMGS